MAILSFFFTLLFILSTTSELTVARGNAPPKCKAPPASDAEMVHFAMNLEYLEGEFFLCGAFGKGLHSFAPYLVKGGPLPLGCKKANLEPLAQQFIEEFGFEEIGHLRAISKTVGAIPEPLLDIGPPVFARLFDEAVGYRLKPPFDPYANSINYFLASYVIPYLGINGYVGAIPYLVNYTTKALVGGLLGVEAGQDAMIRTYLYQHRNEKVVPYNLTVAEVTNRLSRFRNELGMCGLKDEGVVVPPKLGPEGKLETNVLSSNKDSLSYPRTPQEIARVLYGTGSEDVPGGFYPNGANGKIARSFLAKGVL